MNNHKITATQIDPEFQESPLSYLPLGESWPGIIIAGNRYYNSHTTPEFDRISERWGDEKTILRALQLLTRKPYQITTIRGTCQSDWQNIYYPADDYSREDIKLLEIEYFNLGSEWSITSDNDPYGYSQYCYAWDNDGIRREIADETGESPENITLLAFDGYTKTPKYREV